MSRFALILCLFTLVSCGYASKQENVETDKKSAIMGGALVNVQESINAGIVGIYDQKDKSFCTGSLIGENIVLTAAHCVQTKPSRLKIVFGLELDAIMWTHEPDIFREFTRSVAAFKAHSAYNPNEQGDKQTDWGDIAIIKFKGSLPNGYKPVPVLEDDSILKRGLGITVAGYGVSEVAVEPVDAKTIPDIDEAIEYGEVLCEDDTTRDNCVQVDMDGDGVLRQTIAPISSVQETEFRLDESKGHGTCSGDSGGPAYVQEDGQYYLVGVTSRGSPLCDDVGVYTNAVYYKDWIAKTIKQLQ